MEIVQPWFIHLNQDIKGDSYTPWPSDLDLYDVFLLDSDANDIKAINNRPFMYINTNENPNGSCPQINLPSDPLYRDSFLSNLFSELDNRIDPITTAKDAIDLLEHCGFKNNTKY